MLEPITNPAYWSERLRAAQSKNELWKSVYEITPGKWKAIEDEHREIISQYVKPTTTIFDPGCGYGRLITLLPEKWDAAYLGVDFCEDFVRVGRTLFAPNKPQRQFITADLSQTFSPHEKYDLAISISFRGMIRRLLGNDAWKPIQASIEAFSVHQLYLEYDLNEAAEYI